MLMALIRAIGVDDAAALRLLAASPALASARVAQGATRQAAKDYYLDPIGHYVYTGDTALHVAAAAYRCEVARKLIASGADIRARNRRGAEPLHYAADDSGVMPLHRAVRTRCAAAVEALIAGGADANAKNKIGSSPMLLATRNTGRGGSGSPEAKAQQIEIARLLQEAMRAQ